MIVKFVILSISLLALPLQAFADCNINGTDYAEDDPDPFDSCQVCDSSRSADTWSPKICLNAGVDPECQVSVCDAGACAPRQLPEHTRCSVPLCEGGEIRQSECSAAGKCDQNRVKSCKGFACLDGELCSTECTDNSDCQSPASCIRQVCKIKPGADMGTDVGAADMGGDLSSSDAGDTSPDLADGSNPTETDTGGSKPATPSDGGCSTSGSGGNASFFFLVIGPFGFLRRRRR